MKVLIIKTSSLGDIIHTLPAVEDAARALPNIQFDWVVEENFSQIPRWHSHVNRIIPIAFRRWRKHPLKTLQSGEWKNFRKKLRLETYDAIIDAQGLIKSALICWQARGPRYGLDRTSVREPLASLAYQHKFAIDKKQHAVSRVRQLFSLALNYSITSDIPCYGIHRQQFGASEQTQPYCVFLHGTTWPTKHWPIDYWCELAELITEQGYHVKLPWGSSEEKTRAETIAETHTHIEVLPKLDLNHIAQVLANAHSVVSVDTGLAHLAAALNVPTVSVYGPTDAARTGTQGTQQVHLSSQWPCSPCLGKQCTYQGKSTVFSACFAEISPELVAKTLQLPVFKAKK